MKVVFSGLRESVVLIACVAAAVAVLVVPIQQHISMGRLQHYGLSMFLIGLGYILQSVWSWKRLRKWSRLGHVTAGAFIAAAAMVLYANPWLEPKIAVRTPAQENFRSVIIAVFALFMVPQVVICILWINEELAGRSRSGKPSAR